jgi:hypothetical protein
MDAKGRTTLRAAGFAYANVDIGLRSRRAHSSVEIHHSVGDPYPASRLGWAGLLRMLQAGVIVSDYASLMVEILKDNARPEAGAVYGAMDMPWAKLVGQIAHAYGK